MTHTDSAPSSAPIHASSAPHRVMRALRKTVFSSAPMFSLTTATLLGAVTMAHAVQAQEAPYLGVVGSERVPLRAAAGPLYYIVGYAEPGDYVQVRDVLFNWSRVQAPDGTKSYVLQRDIDRRGDGSTGVVNADYVVARAVSIEDGAASPEDSYIEHAVLSRGDAVRIVDTVDDYFLIESPASAYVFLEPDAVRAASAVEIARYEAALRNGPETVVAEAAEEPIEVAPEAVVVDAAPAQAIQTQVQTSDTVIPTVPEIDTQVVIRPTDPAQNLVQAPGDPSPVAIAPSGAGSNGTAAALTTSDVVIVPGPGVQGGGLSGLGSEPTTGTPMPAATGGDVVYASASTFDQVERAMLPEFLLPVTDQPLDDMEVAYQGVLQRSDLTATQVQTVESRLAVIASNRALANTIANLRASQREVDDAVAAGTLPLADPNLRPMQFDAIGMILTSSLYNGDGLPRLFRLVDPSTQRTVAYVEPAGQNLEAFVGEIVGLAGQDAYDPSLRRRVFVPRYIEAIRPEAVAPVTGIDQGDVADAGSMPSAASYELAPAPKPATGDIVILDAE